MIEPCYWSDWMARKQANLTQRVNLKGKTPSNLSVDAYLCFPLNWLRGLGGLIEYNRV